MRNTLASWPGNFFITVFFFGWTQSLALFTEYDHVSGLKNVVIGWASIQSLWKKFTVVHDENLFHSFNGRERKRWTVSTQSTYTKPKNFLTTYGDDLQLTLSVYTLFKWCKLFHSLQYISKKHVSIFSDFFCRAVSFYLTGIDSRKYATVRKLLYSTSKSETIWIFYKYFFFWGIFNSFTKNMRLCC